jgi:hypothetical protein
VSESVLENMLARIRVESETKTNVEITAYEALVLDAKLFELKQLVDDHRRLIDFLRTDEKAKERAAVVEWLARVEQDCVDISIWTRQIRDAVKKGEHNKKHIPVED